MAKMRTESEPVKAKETGVTITPEIIDALANEAEAGYDLRRARRQQVGRPSLGSGTSPRLQFRVPPDLYAAATHRAQQEGRPVSDIARDALRAYIDQAAS